MPRSRERISEVPQRHSTKVPSQLRTSSSETDSMHQRPTTERTPRLGDRRSPRGSQSDSLHQKKLGTRVADLESQLGQAQEELKKLKDQLASTEAAKREAQEELDKKKTEPFSAETNEEHNPAAPLPHSEIQETNEKNSNSSSDSPDENLHETDVFEVPIETLPDKTMVEASHMHEQEDNETKPVVNSTEQLLPEVENPSLEDMILLKDELNLLKSKLEEKDKEIEVLQAENVNLNNKVIEMKEEVSSAQVKEEERAMKLSQTGVVLEESKANVARLKHELIAVETAKEALESEMKTLRVQTEQWRKAADAAAAVLSGGMDMNGKFAMRCGSMDKHVENGGGVFELAGACTGFAGSPLMADDLGKRKGSGIRMFGDLWKKKGQK